MFYEKTTICHGNKKKYADKTYMQGYTLLFDE